MYTSFRPHNIYRIFIVLSSLLSFTPCLILDLSSLVMRREIFFFFLFLHISGHLFSLPFLSYTSHCWSLSFSFSFSFYLSTCLSILSHSLILSPSPLSLSLSHALSLPSVLCFPVGCSWSKKWGRYTPSQQRKKCTTCWRWELIWPNEVYDAVRLIIVE